MENKEYWKDSLSNVLEKEEITDILVEKIIGISEMEYEYTEFESHKPGKEDNPLKHEVKSLEKQIQIYKDFIAKKFKVDFVNIEYGEVRLSERPL